MNTLIRDEFESLQTNDTNLVNLAKMALAADDKAQALQYWRQAQTNYPTFVASHSDSLNIALGLTLYDEAEAMMSARIRKEPGHQEHAEGYARVAEERGDLPEAIVRWAAVRKQFRYSWLAYVREASCRRRLKQVSEAETIVQEALGVFPRSEHVWAEWVRCAEQREDWESMLDRAREFQQLLDHVAAGIGIGTALIKLGRFDEASNHLAKASVRWPIAIEIPIAQAQLAYAQNDKIEAARRWSNVRMKFPLSLQGYRGEIGILRELAQLEDAEVIAEECINRFPDNPWPAIEAASLAQSQKKWNVAIERWALVRDRWPARREAFVQGAMVLKEVGRQAEADLLIAEATKRFTCGSETE